jgi:hypothetical protein
MNTCCGPGAYNICIYQGATLSQVFLWTAGAGCCPAPVGAGPQAVDITGYAATMQFRTYYGGPLLYDATPNLVLGGVAGTITLSIPALVTETFTWWQGVYDLLLTSSQGVVTPLLAGTVMVTPSISA